MSRAAALTSELRAEVDKRLQSSHEDRIARLADSVHQSLLSPFDKPELNGGLHGQQRIADVFDELIKTDRVSRIQQLNDEVAFRDRELSRLRENLEKVQLEACIQKEQRAAAEQQASRTNQHNAVLEAELAKLQREHEDVTDQVKELSISRAAAERAAAREQARADVAEQTLARVSADHDQLKADHRRSLQEHAQQLADLRKELQTSQADHAKHTASAAAKEQDLTKQLATTSTSLAETRTQLSAAKSDLASLQQQLASATTELATIKRERAQLSARATQAEAGLAESDKERIEVRNKYIRLGDQVELLLQNEAALKDSAAQQQAALQEALEAAQQQAAGLQQECEALRGQLAAAQRELEAQERGHKKVLKKLDKKMLQVAEEYQSCRQELLVKSAEVLDLQQGAKEAALTHEADLAAAEGQVDALQQALAQMQEQVAAAEERAAAAVSAAEAQATEQLQLGLRQQALKYERQIQELELQKRYMSAIDALSGGLTARTLDQGPPLPPSAAAGAGVGGPEGPRSTLDVFDARLRRTLEAHMQRAENVQALEGKLVAVQREVQAEATRRLAAAEADWSSRLAAREQELQHNAQMQLQQAENRASMEKERLSGKLQEAQAAASKLEQQLSSCQQELADASREASKAKMQLEEARAARMTLQARADEAERTVSHLRGLVSAVPGHGEKEMLADLLAKLELRTNERNTAMQDAAAATSRIKAAEAAAAEAGDKVAALQRQLAAAQASLTQEQAAKAAVEGRVTAANTALSEAEAAGQALKEKLKQQEEEATKAQAARKRLQQEVVAAQAEAAESAAAQQKLRAALKEAEEAQLESAAAARKLRTERDTLEAEATELHQRLVAAQSGLAAAQDEARRLGLAMAGLEMSKAGLQRHLSWYEHDRTNALLRGESLPHQHPHTTSSSGGGGHSTSYPGGHSEEHSSAGGTSGADAAQGSGAAAASGGTSGHPGASLGDSLRLQPLALPGGGALGGVPLERGLSGLHGPSRLAMASRASGGGGGGGGGIGRRRSTLHASLDLPDGMHGLQDVDGLMARFDEERRLLLERYEALDAENAELRGALLAAQHRAEEAAFTADQLRGNLERSRALGLADPKQDLTDKVLLAEALRVSASHGASEASELNLLLQRELERVRGQHQAAAEKAATAERRVLMLEGQISDLQGAVAQARKDAAHNMQLKLNRLQVTTGSQLSALRSKVGLLREEVGLQLGAALKDNAAAVEGLHHKWSEKFKAAQAAAEAAAAAAAAQHQKEVAELQQAAADARAAAEQEASEAAQQIAELQEVAGVMQEGLLGVCEEVAGVLGLEPLDWSGLAAGELVGQAQALLQALYQSLSDTTADRDQLLADSSSLAADLTRCATNLQTLVATLGFALRLPQELQHGLNAKDQGVFEEQLAALQQAISAYLLSERQQVASRIESGPLAELQAQLAAAQAEADKRAGDVRELKADKEADMAKFEEALALCRSEAVQAADLARQESLAALKAELGTIRSQLAELQESHAAEVTSIKGWGATQLGQHVKAADRIIKELEGTASSLQQQLAAEVERAEAATAAVKRHKEEQERKQQLEARKERRQTGEIDNLRTRLREYEAREKEKEEEMKALKRSLRQKELSLLGGPQPGLTDRP